MTARPAPTSPTIVLVAALLVALASLTTAGPAHADQTVRFDGPDGAPHVSLIGDSTLTAVRWYADYGPLVQYDFVLSAESCRRTIEQSCISREGYRSQNVVAAMRSLSGELGDVVVVMSGYNDPQWTIDEAIAAVTAEARSQGVEHVVWLTLRTSPDVDYSDPQEQSSINTFREYNAQLVDAAAASDGFVQVADWASYSHGASGWFEADGVHLTPRGVDALTTFLAGTIGQVLAGEDVSPAAAPWTVLVPGAEGELVTDVQDALIRRGVELPGGADGVYGNDTMAAVAAYQDTVEGLQVTGAVDIATARSLGVVADTASADDTATADDTAEGAPALEAPAAGPPTDIADETAGAAEPADGSVASAGQSGGTAWFRWAAVAGAIVLALALAVVARRRYVVAQRAARRWARVHPSTSPHRSIADARRDGRLPVRSTVDRHAHHHAHRDGAHDAGDDAGDDTDHDSGRDTSRDADSFERTS
jgi:hypothetical protein